MAEENLTQSNEKVRIEIIFSQALEEDFQEEFENNNVGKFFTKISPVMGAGYSNPHLGDAVWPQLNMIYIFYCSREEAETIKNIVRKLRKLYATEGIACFESSGLEC